MSKAAEETTIDPVVERLDRLVTLLELALAPQLAEARLTVRPTGSTPRSSMPPRATGRKPRSYAMQSRRPPARKSGRSRSTSAS